jgi:phosphoglycolate phosphatase
MRPTHLIFDLDGTLIDSAPAILEGFGAVLGRAGLTPTVPLSKTLIGPPLLETLSRITASSDPEFLRTLANAFKAYYDDEGLLLTEPYREIDATLRHLKAQGLRLHLATNKRWRPTERILKLLGWDLIFDSAYAQDKASTPYVGKATMLRSQIAEQGIEPQSSVYIGDTAEDGFAAEANGLFFAAVDWGYGNFDAWPGVARWTRFTSPAALLGLLDIPEYADNGRAQ